MGKRIKADRRLQTSSVANMDRLDALDKYVLTAAAAGPEDNIDMESIAFGITPLERAHTESITRDKNAEEWRRRDFFDLLCFVRRDALIFCQLFITGSLFRHAYSTAAFSMNASGIFYVMPERPTLNTPPHASAPTHPPMRQTANVHPCGGPPL